MIIRETGTIAFSLVFLIFIVCAAATADVPAANTPGEDEVAFEKETADHTNGGPRADEGQESVPLPGSRDIIHSDAETVEEAVPPAEEELLPEEYEGSEETGDMKAVNEIETGGDAEVYSAQENMTGGEDLLILFKEGEQRQESPEFLFVRELVEIESGYNDGNPIWSPDGNIIAFERGTRDRKEIVITTRDGISIEKIYYQLSSVKGEMDFFFPGISEDVSYNSGISWSNMGDRFVFMSNGGGGNYDLYMRELGRETTVRLTDHIEKDGQAHWSPKDDHIVFVSGREGKGDLYIMDLTTKQDRRITKGEKSYLYPQWSPDGKKISMIYGGNENHDIYVIDDLERPFESVRPLAVWDHDDLRPVWSPDGSKIAFYSNYNEYNDPKIWSLIVIASNGDDPSEGDGLIGHVIARDVIPDIERGPAWMPDSNRIVYVKNDRRAYNPIYLADILEKKNVPLETGTKMNHDVVCSSDGTIAFRAQVQQWDHIYVAKLKE